MIRVQILNDVVYVSFCANAHGKSINLSILLIANIRQTFFLALVGQTLEKENSEFKPTLPSHPVHYRGVR